MPRIHRKHFEAAVEAGIAACPALQHPEMASAVRMLRQYAGWQGATMIGRFTDVEGEHECPLSYAGVLSCFDDGTLVTPFVESTNGVVTSYADLAPFWVAFDNAARPKVMGWDGDPSIPIRVVSP